MEDPRLGLPTALLRISKAFGESKVLAITKLLIFLGVGAAILSFLAGAGIYDVLTTGEANRGSVILLTLLALAAWGLIALLVGGGLSSRAAGVRSEIRLYQNGFVLLQGLRFGGEKKDTCLWNDVRSVQEKTFAGRFLGYGIVKNDGSNIFLSANFEGLKEKFPYASLSDSLRARGGV